MLTCDRYDRTFDIHRHDDISFIFTNTDEAKEDGSEQAPGFKLEGSLMRETRSKLLKVCNQQRRYERYERDALQSFQKIMQAEETDWKITAIAVGYKLLLFTLGNAKIAKLEPAQYEPVRLWIGLEVLSRDYLTFKNEGEDDIDYVDFWVPGKHSDLSIRQWRQNDKGSREIEVWFQVCEQTFFQKYYKKEQVKMQIKEWH